jgi:truncated hemoglobin YjbI
LAEAHKRLRIEPEHFEKVGLLLKETLTEGGVEEADIQTLMSVVAKTRADVIRD